MHNSNTGLQLFFFNQVQASLLLYQGDDGASAAQRKSACLEAVHHHLQQVVSYDGPERLKSLQVDHQCLVLYRSVYSPLLCAAAARSDLLPAQSWPSSQPLGDLQESCCVHVDYSTIYS